MNTRTYAWIFGLILVAIGLLGYVPGITDNDLLFNVFAVDNAHNVIHIATGIIAVIAASMSDKASRNYFLTFGVIYGLITIIGFVQGTTVLGVMSVNAADNVLHLVIVAASFLFAFAGEPFGGRVPTKISRA